MYNAIQPIWLIQQAVSCGGFLFVSIYVLPNFSRLPISHAPTKRVCFSSFLWSNVIWCLPFLGSVCPVEQSFPPFLEIQLVPTLLAFREPFTSWLFLRYWRQDVRWAHPGRCNMCWCAIVSVWFLLFLCGHFCYWGYHNFVFITVHCTPSIVVRLYKCINKSNPRISIIT